LEVGGAIGYERNSTNRCSGIGGPVGGAIRYDRNSKNRRSGIVPPCLTLEVRGAIRYDRNSKNRRSGIAAPSFIMWERWGCNFEKQKSKSKQNDIRIHKHSSSDISLHIKNGTIQSRLTFYIKCTDTEQISMHIHTTKLVFA
jgi:hypothetical protein